MMELVKKKRWPQARKVSNTLYEMSNFNWNIRFPNVVHEYIRSGGIGQLYISKRVRCLVSLNDLGEPVEFLLLD